MGSEQTRPVSVAQYVRMSTDVQDLSIDRQIQENETFAAIHNLQIVETYTDSGRSGLSFEKRPGLIRLLADVEKGGAEFSKVLVFDVSRWGRFQDVDESAFHEFTCRRHGVEVCYTSEAFENNHDPINTIVKNIKRVMAAEYSRDLSQRVAKGKTLKAEKGFRQGSTPGLGLRRMMVDRNGNRRGLIAFGERKANQSDHVILVPGPAEEVTLVRRCFELYVNEGWSFKDIGTLITDAGYRTEYGNPYTYEHVARMLKNEKYIGVAVYGQQTGPLGSIRRKKDPAEWIRIENAYASIVDPDLFEKARKKACTYTNPLNLTDIEMLERLKRLYEEKGHLSQRLIKECSYTPHWSTYISRFGGLLLAYQYIGFKPKRLFQKKGRKHGIPHKLTNDEMLKRLKRLHSEQGRISAKVIDYCPYTPSSVSYKYRFGKLRTAYKLAKIET